MKMKNLIENTSMSPKLAKAIINQSGGWDQFKESAPDIANHGIDGGFSGWIYYSDTCEFFKKNRKDILAYAEEMAESMGEDMLSMIQNFGVFQNDQISTNDLAKALYTGKGDDATRVQNVMAWFVVEELARNYVDMVEDEI